MFEIRIFENGTSRGWYWEVFCDGVVAGRGIANMHAEAKAHADACIDELAKRKPLQEAWPLESEGT